MPQATDAAGPPDDAVFMQMALEQARQAAEAGEVPVGAVVVRNGKVLGLGRNSPVQACDPSAHAEVVALRAAAQAVGNYRLDDCTLYVTLEPCAMCCGAILHSRIRRLVYGATDPKTGCAGSVTDLFAHTAINHQTRVEQGLLAEQAAGLLQDFFQRKRVQQRSVSQPLRDDALRTPEHCFAPLANFAWTAHYRMDLPCLAGLRLHYLDEGPPSAAPVLLCLHPVPGWSYHYTACIAPWLDQGWRVVVPDLIGFGKSDKPKREAAHTLAFHLQVLLEFIDHLALHGVRLVVPHASHALAQALLAQAAERIQGLQVEGPGMELAGDSYRYALAAPYPDAGHRAAERAFAGQDWC